MQIILQSKYGKKKNTTVLNQTTQEKAEATHGIPVDYLSSHSHTVSGRARYLTTGPSNACVDHGRHPATVFSGRFM